MPLLFPLAVFLSAALLFLVEPMFARMLLPKLGGAPAVWNTCVALYQTLLLAGYAYAHLLARRLSVKTQIATHVALLLAAALVLPVAIDRAWAPAPSENPSVAAARLLLTSLGVPFFLLAANGPLLQQWFAWRHGAASNPYRLYAASNVGSLLALLAYPIAIEPTLGLREQSLLWTGGYAALLLIAAGCGAATWNTTPQATRQTGAAPAPGVGHGAAARLRWLGLAFVPSSLMLSVTTFVSTDIAAIPLLWVVPLALYLGTLVVAFADRPIVRWTMTDAVFPATLVGIIALIMADDGIPAKYAIVAHMGGFVLVALACHMRLAAHRPDTTRLTEFYLWVAAGGALGGLFNTFAAPVLFATPVEYPLVLIAACVLFADAARWPQSAIARVRALAAMVVPALVLIALTPIVHRLDWGAADARVGEAMAAIPALASAYALRRNPIGLGVALALLLTAAEWARIENRVTLHVERSFFGVLRVTDTGFEHVLQSGTTNHGSQAVDPALRCEPLSYYSREGPVGQLLHSFNRDRQTGTRLGVVGLGTASMAAYARPGDSLTFFEINPAVERLARNADYFTYLRDCAPTARVVLGDARLSLERMPDGTFDLLMIDAFSSDALPVHLLTSEAMAIYIRKLASPGLLLLHISNRHLDPAPVIAAIVEAQGLTGAIQRHRPVWKDTRQPQAIPSRWIVVSRQRADLLPLLATGRWQSPVATPGPLWTDDYSNVLRVMTR